MFGNSWALTVWCQNSTKLMDSHDFSHVLLCQFHSFPTAGMGQRCSSHFVSPWTHHHSRSIPQDGGCLVLTWAARWGQDVLIYNACYRDLREQSNCCGDKRKQSAAHPHTAGYCWTKDDYLHWYKKQCILFLELKINPANIYSKHLAQ